MSVYLPHMTQVHWLSEHAAATALLDEVERESDRVWNFIIAREIETPDRFRAIQSYRCAFFDLNVRPLVMMNISCFN